jgi:hypothetical protein
MDLEDPGEEGERARAEEVYHTSLLKTNKLTVPT